MPHWINAENLIALATLSALEIVLGIDNIVFISILTGKVHPRQRPAVRRIGLALAMVMRILLLLGITWVMGLTRPLFEIFNHPFSGRDLILFGGGLFLIAKSTFEIHDKLEGPGAHGKGKITHASFGSVLLQIIALDMIFSLDSVITAVGMAGQLWVMITAVILAVGVMMIFAGAVSGFIERHPTFKMLALAFLLLIGVMLTIEGVGQHINKGYIYFAMAFSLFVEFLNLRLRKKSEPVHLHESLPS